jgi:List-Bact-rpt repeat protein
MTKGQWVYATFQPYTFRLTVVLSGAGAGAVNGASGTSTIACATGSTAGCAANVAGGTTLTLRAAPAAGSVFAGWAGACSGTAPVCDLDMSRAAYAYATFARGG